MKNNKSIRIGIIGVGHLGNFHLKQLTTIQTASIVGIFDIDFERSEEISREYNVPVFPNIESLLNEIDAVSIVTPTRHHYEIADKALNNDCHVFIEKPITDNLSHADKLLKKAKEKDKIIQVGHIERFNPAFMALDICQMKPRFIEAHRLAPFNIRGNDVPVVLDLMIHDLDIILSLVDSKIKDIRATGVKVVSRNIDIANSRLEFDNGCVANITASRISQKEMRKMRLFQEDNYVTIDFKEKILEEYKICKGQPDNTSKTKMVQLEMDDNKYIAYNKPNIISHDALKEELLHFIHSIHYSNQPNTDGKSATESLALALEIQKIIDK